MAVVREITVGVESSIKLAEYQYIKPKIEITYILGETEKPGSIMKEGRERLKIEMVKLEKEFKPKQKTTDVPF